jgi:hypothetical protein
VFDQEIMMPKVMSQMFWDHLFEVQALSISDDSVYTGRFFDARRAL